MKKWPRNGYKLNCTVGRLNAVSLSKLSCRSVEFADASAEEEEEGGAAKRTRGDEGAAADVDDAVTATVIGEFEEDAPT